ISNRSCAAAVSTAASHTMTEVRMMRVITADCATGYGEKMAIHLAATPEGAQSCRWFPASTTFRTAACPRPRTTLQQAGCQRAETDEPSTEDRTERATGHRVRGPCH